MRRARRVLNRPRTTSPDRPSSTPRSVDVAPIFCFQEADERSADLVDGGRRKAFAERHSVQRMPEEQPGRVQVHHRATRGRQLTAFSAGVGGCAVEGVAPLLEAGQPPTRRAVLPFEADPAAMMLWPREGREDAEAGADAREMHTTCTTATLSAGVRDSWSTRGKEDQISDWWAP